MTRDVLLLNGPNLNMLGKRQPEIYGRDTLEDVVRSASELGAELGLEVDARQSNHEGELVTLIQEARGTKAAIVINPGAYSHTSVAILDALNLFEGIVIEVHISNIHRREPYYHRSYVSYAATGVIAGLGVRGYVLALDAISELLRQGEPAR